MIDSRFTVRKSTRILDVMQNLATTHSACPIIAKSKEERKTINADNWFRKLK